MAGRNTPTHVSIILGDTVRILGMTGPVRRGLVDAGRTASRSRYGARVSYESGPSNLDNGDLIELLQLLAYLGVGFARDFTQLWPPAAVVSELISRGVNFENPWACGFDGRTWHQQAFPWLPS